MLSSLCEHHHTSWRLIWGLNLWKSARFLVPGAIRVIWCGLLVSGLLVGLLCPISHVPCGTLRVHALLAARVPQRLCMAFLLDTQGQPHETESLSQFVARDVRSYRSYWLWRLSQCKWTVRMWSLILMTIVFSGQGHDPLEGSGDFSFNSTIRQNQSVQAVICQVTFLLLRIEWLCKVSVSCESAKNV